MNYSYVTLLTDNTYVYGVALLVESLQRVNTKYPLHVLINDEVSEPVIELLNQLPITYSYVENISISDEMYNYNASINPRMAAIWKNCYTKFHVFNQTQFDKIVFLDADIMILKNIDHLFECPHMTAALDGEYFNIWPDWPHFNNGCVVIEPSKELFEDIVKFAKEYNGQPGYPVADQEILNFYYSDWAKKPELHLNKYYNIFAPYVPEEAISDIDENAYFIHYIGRKPWAFWLRHSSETYTEKYYLDAKKMVEERIQPLDWKKIRKKVTITVYAICKNEMNHIQRWIKSFGEADHVCILDTGSTDGTWEYLQSIKNKRKNLIIDQQEINPWRYDKARNISMTLIPSDTVVYFMADIDEVIKEKGWTDKVRTAWDPLFDRGSYKYHRDVGPNDEIIRTIPEYRLHSNHWNHWVNVVHEALVNRFGQKTFFVETCTPIDIEVWHYPDKNKQTNYMELCELDLQENPDDWVMHLQLAIEYEIREEYDKAYSHFETIIHKSVGMRDFEIARCYAGMSRINSLKDNFERALIFAREGRILFPNYTDNYILAAEIYFNHQRYDTAIELCKEAIKRCNPSEWCNYFDINSYYAYWLMGIANANIQNYESALAYLELAYNKNPINEITEKKNAVMDALQDALKRKE